MHIMFFDKQCIIAIGESCNIRDYSTDWTYRSAIFICFPKWRSHPGRRHFYTPAEIFEAYNAFVKALEDVESGICGLLLKWKKCKDVEGDYVEWHFSSFV